MSEHANEPPPARAGEQADGRTAPVYRDTEQRWPTPVVVSIQSRVAMGHVGNSAATLPLQLAGYEVVDVPTALLSNHPFYPGFTGRLLEPADVAQLLTGVAARGVGHAASAVLSGFLGTAGVGPVVADFLTHARPVNPALRYVCDPVLGEAGSGYYVDPDLLGHYRDRLLPTADVSTPNLFELEQLTSGGVRDLADVQRRADHLLGERPAALVLTGAALTDTPDDCLDTIVVTAGAGGRGTWRVRGPRVSRHFDGTGDVFTALLTAAWLRGPATPATVPSAAAAAVAGTAEVVRRTVADATKELQLVATGMRMVTPSVRVVAERLR